MMFAPTRTVMFAGLLAYAATACVTTPAGNVESRAAFEMDCPAKELEVTPLSKDTVGVSGCGRRLVYIKQCKMDVGCPAFLCLGPLVQACTWVLNSDSRKERPLRGAMAAPESHRH